VSHSVERPLRGLSYQRTHPQRKLVQALSGHIFDVAVDVRPASSTYGHWGGYILDAQSGDEVCIRWDIPILAIDWPLSDKDRLAPEFLG